MNLLSDIITYVRRLVKTYDNSELSDSLIIDYINRFWIMDVDARLQLFDLKTVYSFQTIPGVDRYNMPLYDVQTETPLPELQTIGLYPVYQGFMGPAYLNGVQVGFTTQRNNFFRSYPNFIQNMTGVAVGDGTAGPYTLTLPILNQTSAPLNPPFNGIMRGHVDMAGIVASGNNEDPISTTDIRASVTNIPLTSIHPTFTITSTDSTGKNVVVTDSGMMLDSDFDQGLLIAPGSAPFGYTPLSTTFVSGVNTINYATGQCVVTFVDSNGASLTIPEGVNINAQAVYLATGLPRQILFYDNTLTLRSPPDKQYTVELDAYLSPSAFFSTSQSIPFAYMSEYIARGAARKIMTDTGDEDQARFYEPLFREQEQLVWKRSGRQFTSTRTETIYSQGMGGSVNNNIQGGVL